MNILVTGGAGFIGSHFVNLLLSETAHEVFNFDLLTYAANPERLNHFEQNPRHHFIKGDIADAALLHEVFKTCQIDAVVNFAAESHVDRSILDPQVFIRTNIVGVQNLIDVARKHQLQRFVQVSTDEVYGSLKASDAPFTEQSPLQPNSPYAASKTSSDLLLLASHHTYNFPVIITRCSNNYGPYQHPEKLIPLSLYRALNNEKIPVYGDGSNVRDWIYVEDHCRAILLALQKGKLGEVYNIGANSEQNNLKLVQTLLQILGKSPELITFVTDRPGHDFRYAINSRKTRENLAWQPRVSFAQGMEQTINWYLDHQDWLHKKTAHEYQEYFSLQYGVIT